MDPVSLDSAVTEFFIPHLTKMGEKVPKVYRKIGWDSILEIFKDRPASASTAAKFTSKADDQDNRAAFEAQRRKALKENQDFAKEAGITNTGGTVATNESMALDLGGDLKGNLVIGDGNTISQTGDKPSAMQTGRKTRKGR